MAERRHLDLSGVSIEIAATRIVEAIDLFVLPGEIVGLIGPNGSGKSTLLRSIYRLLRPITGQVRLGSADVWSLSARDSARRTGVVVQESSSDFEFTVRDVVTMGRTPHKGLMDADSPEDEAIVRRALDQVQMRPFADRSFATLSGGEKQRILIARALAQTPELLVLDEPTNHLDIRYQLETLDLVRDLGLTTLVTLHDLNLAAAYCHRLYLLNAGRIVAHGSPEQVLRPALIRAVFSVEAVVDRHPTTGGLHLAFTSAPPTHAVDSTGDEDEGSATSKGADLQWTSL